MTEWRAADANFEERVRASFAEQRVMSLIGARMEALAPGYCRVALPFRAELTQQNGFFHAGVTSIVGDSAGGYAGYTLMPEDSDVLTVEFKINLLRPAAGALLVAEGNVVRAGRRLSFTEVRIHAHRDGNAILCASMSQTLARVDKIDG